MLSARVRARCRAAAEGAQEAPVEDLSVGPTRSTQDGDKRYPLVIEHFKLYFTSHDVYPIQLSKHCDDVARCVPSPVVPGALCPVSAPMMRRDPGVLRCILVILLFRRGGSDTCRRRRGRGREASTGM